MQSKIDDIFFLGLKIVLLNAAKQVLVLQMHKNGAIFWELPGGRMQQGEMQVEGLLREIKEETGIEAVENIKYCGMHLSQFRVPVHGTTAGLLFLLYTGSVKVDSHITLSGDHRQYAWVSAEQALELLGTAYGEEIRRKLLDLGEFIC